MPWDDNLAQGSPAYSIAASKNPRIRVIAGPGTGKSFAMKRRVARLLEEGVDPKRILPVTFTRVAADDLHRELIGMGVKRCDEVVGTTLHRLALKILTREHAMKAVGRTPRPLNDFEIEPLIHDLAARHSGIREVRRRIKAYEAAWARLQHDVPGTAKDPLDIEFEKDLLAWLAFHRAMLIGEVIPHLYKYLSSNPHAPERGEYSDVLVDEFQDLNRAEQGVVELLSVEAAICIVGDDDQSIYGFKHAHPDGILNWLGLNADADDLTLDLCHRCPTTIVEMANTLIGNNSTRSGNRKLKPVNERGSGKVEILQYKTIDDEVRAIAKRIVEMVKNGAPAGDILVLAQRGVIGKPIFEALQLEKIPVKSYYSEAELDSIQARERFAYLRLLASRDDRVSLRWLLGLGKADWRSKAYHRVQKVCADSGFSVWETLATLSIDATRARYTRELVERFRTVAAELERLQAVINSSGLVGLIDDMFPDSESDFRDIRTLCLTVVNEVNAEDMGQFVRLLSDLISKPEIPSEVNEVRVMSLHKSKGLSSPVTFIAGCVEGLLPKQPDLGQSEATRIASIEEQRRLFYVGLTRVKAQPDREKPGTLILSYSQTMPIGQAKQAGIIPARTRYGKALLQASRFISEMGESAPHPVAE